MIINIKFCFPRLRIHKEAKKKNIGKQKVQNFKNYYSREYYWGGIMENGVARIYYEHD